MASRTASTATRGSANTAMVPSPIRLTMCPPASSRGGSMARATRRSSLSVASSPARNDQLENSTRSVKTIVTSSLAGRRDTASVSACQTWRAPRLTSRDAPPRSPSSRPAARAAARGPPWPAVESGSPKSGSPGKPRRARRTSEIRPGLRFVVRTHCAAPRRDDGECCRNAGESGVVTVCSGSPDACRGPSSTRLTVGGLRRDRQ